VKEALKALLRTMAYNAPWGARYAMIEGCLAAMRMDEMYGYLLPKLKLAEIAATGDRGVISSPGGDNMVIAEYAQTGTFATLVTEALKSFFTLSGGTYMDIGANIGLMTLPLAIDPRVRCIAFEPEPVNFGFLQRNIARNAPAAAVELQQVALFHSRTTLSLAIAEGNIGDHRVTLHGIPGRRTVEVPAVPLDDFADRVTGPLAVKIDTQGAEPFIIAGGGRVLAMAGLLVMEFCPFLMRQLNGDPEIPIELVSRFSSIAVMRGGKAEQPRYVPAAEAIAALRSKLRTAVDSDEDYLDIIARR
jgi:FkbM family methyltransferase